MKITIRTYIGMGCLIVALVLGCVSLGFAGLSIIQEQPIDVGGGDAPARLYSVIQSDVGGESISFSPITNGFALNYAVPADESYVGLIMQPSFIAGGGSDLSGFEVLTFRVRGSVNNMPLKIEIQNSSAPASGRNQASLYITDYLDAGITTLWQTVEIPLDAFANLSTRTTITQIGFLMEHDYAAACGFATNGTIEIDSLGFSSASLGYVRMDHFGDNWGWLGVGGNMGNLETHSASFDFSDGHNAPGVMKSSFDVATSGWCGNFFLLGGGADGWTAQECDFSAYNNFTFWVKPETPALDPRIFKLEIIDNDGAVNIQVINFDTNDWTKITVDLNGYGGTINKSSIKQINIIYEESQINGQTGALTGSLLFDDFQFE